MTQRKVTRAASKPAGQAARPDQSETTMGPPVVRRKADDARGKEEPTPPRKGRPAVAGEPRSVRLEVMVTADERARIEAVAGRGHVSEWVRRVVLAALRAEIGR